MTTIFRNGRFFVGGSERQTFLKPFSNCMVVTDDRIKHIGEEADLAVTVAIKNGASIADVQDRVVIPGFIDGHVHLLLLGLALRKVDLGACKNMDDISATIASYAKANPSLPRILCHGWEQPTTNGIALASMLDPIDERPIFIDAKDLHSAWCNSAALKELDVELMKDPVGGKIHRDEHGRPSGLLSEAAAVSLVWPHIARLTPLEDRIEALRTAGRVYTKAGYTGMVEMAMDENAWAALQLLQSRERLPFRIAAHWLISPSDDESATLKQVHRAIELREKFNANSSPSLRITGIKVICDGVVDACTAALSEPYSSNGILCSPLWTPKMLAPVVKTADLAGLQCALHAIGDAAIKNAIDVLEEFGTPGRRHRIEHLELTSPEDARRLGKGGITASIQPVHSDPAINRAWPKLIGESRCERAFAYKEFLEGGAVLALGSDAPTAPHAPLSNLYCATTRRSAREPESLATTNEKYALPLATAMTAATMGAAYSCFADAETGRLKAGLKADFAIVDMKWASEDLLKAHVCQTWFEGKKVYDCDDEER